ASDSGNPSAITSATSSGFVSGAYAAFISAAPSQGPAQPFATSLAPVAAVSAHHRRCGGAGLAGLAAVAPAPGRTRGHAGGHATATVADCGVGGTLPGTSEYPGPSRAAGLHGSGAAGTANGSDGTAAAGH